MDPFSNPQLAAVSSRRGLRAPLAIAGLIVVMVVVAIGGSAYWRPEPSTRATLELGGATPVGLSTRPAGETISRALEFAAPSVVFLTMPTEGRSGSGVVVHEAGFVVTNAHVVEGVERLLVAFSDGSEYEAEVYGIDPSTDLAVVKVEADRPLPAAPLGNSDTLKVGEFVVAVGAPFGLEATATSGIVSGLHRSGLGLARFEDFIVTDAPINRGNSGGALVNLRGEVVGINTAIIAGEDDAHGLGTFAGVGFAIPVNVMRVVAQRLIGDGGLGTPEDEDVGVGEPGTVARSNERKSGGGTPQTVALVSAGRAATVAAAPAQGTQLDASVALVEPYGDNGASLGSGSGFVVDSAVGLVLVTNEHVVRDAGTIRVFFRRDSGPDLRVAAETLAVDPRRDLALLALSVTDGLVPLRLGGGGDLAVGQAVAAAGVRTADGGLDVAVNRGAVVELDVRLLGLASAAMIVATDASIQRGDSGGPLLDGSGDAVGVMLAHDAQEAVASVGGRRSYAVLFRPNEELAELLHDVESPGFDPGFRPVFPRSDEAPFILVVNVDPEGLGAQAGLRDGDRILSFDGVDVTADESIQMAAFDAFTKTRSGTTVRIGLQRKADDGEWRDMAIDVTVPQRSPVPVP